MPQAGTAKAIGAMPTIKTKNHLLAIKAILAKKSFITPFCIYVFVAKFVSKYPEIVKTIPTFQFIGVVSRIFIEMATNIQIAVLIIGFLINPLALNRVGIKK